MKRVVVAWGRFNPPHMGHKKLMDIAKTTAGEDPFFIYPTHSFGGKKDDNGFKSNPLPADRKNYWLTKMFPEYRNNIIYDTSIKTIIQLFQKYQEEYDDIVLVAGDDQFNDYVRTITTYNNKEYTYRNIDFVNAGKRDAKAKGAEGMSATKMRLAAATMNIGAFKKAMPSTLNDRDIKELMGEVVNGLK